MIVRKTLRKIVRRIVRRIVKKTVRMSEEDSDEDSEDDSEEDNEEDSEDDMNMNVILPTQNDPRFIYGLDKNYFKYKVNISIDFARNHVTVERKRLLSIALRRGHIEEEIKELMKRMVKVYGEDDIKVIMLQDFPLINVYEMMLEVIEVENKEIARRSERISNHVTHLLDDLNFDTVTLFVKGLEGHSWQVVAVVDEKDGNLYFTDGVDELIKYYKLKQKFCIIFSVISTREVEMLMFDTKGVEIDYGFPPLLEVIQISSDDDDVIELLPTQPNFVSVMNTFDWKYEMNIPIEFAKTFLGLNGRKKLGKDDEVEFTLTVANDNRIEFQTEITRVG
ncbi:hypothetical protein GH714_033749 [Hevea brasiliensis]|uniref:Uncharacterized protein n=1 Tax=Hevea brasiliensis TaxID=3981 RepID=A0A6A6L7Y2_HEVBR|nr:hypothetical protein GH714_033749 [Hevea brasiliensis]